MEAIQYGQCPDVPAELSEFSQKIKLMKERNDTSNHQLKMKYTHGAVKPSKHMLLGMGFVLRVTGSKKVQEISNLFSYIEYVTHFAKTCLYAWIIFFF